MCVFVVGVCTCVCVFVVGVYVCLRSVCMCIFSRCARVLAVGIASMIDLLLYVITVRKIHESRTLASRRSG